MSDVIPNQDGVEAFRRLMLDEHPARKAAIDKLLGQTEARARRQGFANAIPPAGSPYTYPAVDGTFATLIDVAEAQAVELAELREAVERDPFG